MFKVYQRYLAASFLYPFVGSALFFVCFLLTFRLLSIMRIVINKDVSLSVVMEIVGHVAASFVPMAIPFSALLATIYTLSKLSDDSEIVVLRSFGVKKYQLVMPFMILGVMIAGCLFSVNDKLIPRSKSQFRNTLIKLTSKGMLNNVKPGKFFTEIPNVILFAEKVKNGGANLESIFIHMENANNGVKNEQIIVAHSGSLIKHKRTEWEIPSLRLNLLDGNIIKSKGGELEKIVFKEYDFPIMGGGEISSFITKDGMRTNSQLSEIIDKNELEIDQLRKSKKNNWKAEVDGIMKRLIKSKIEFWSRFNAPLQILLFIFLGFSLGIKKGRGRTKNSTAIGMLVLLIYYVIFFLGVSLARKGLIPAYVTTFVPTLFCLLGASILYKKLDWMS